jgi:hypothetical protein
MPQNLFYWLPVDGARHAISGAAGSHQVGEWADTLCEMPVQTRVATQHEWIMWRTCDECWKAAHALLDRLAAGQ